MKVGDRVKLIDAPPGWGDAIGRIVPDTHDMVLVEWSNGATCYERPEALEEL